MEEKGRKSLAVQTDVRSEAQVEELVSRTIAEFNGVDILVCSHGISGVTHREHDPDAPMTLEAITEDDWDLTLDVNLKGPAFCAQAAARLMLSHGGGRIVNVADVIGLQPWPRFPHHSVAKAGLIMLTQVLAATLAPTIRVNAVAPGPVLKPEGMSEERWQEIGAASLLGRAGRAADVAEAVLFLVCSNYITGEVLVVDGGSRFIGENIHEQT